jgi:hypothetical protein
MSNTEKTIKTRDRQSFEDMTAILKEPIPETGKGNHAAKLLKLKTNLEAKIKSAKATFEASVEALKEADVLLEKILPKD